MWIKRIQDFCPIFTAILEIRRCLIWRICIDLTKSSIGYLDTFICAGISYDMIQSMTKYFLFHARIFFYILLWKLQKFLFDSTQKKLFPLKLIVFINLRSRNFLLSHVNLNLNYQKLLSWLKILNIKASRQIHSTSNWTLTTKNAYFE